MQHFSSIRVFVITVVAALLLCGCKEPTVSYQTEAVVADVSGAYTYYYLLFREVDNAWAVVDANAYATTPIVEAERTINFISGNPDTIKINYNKQDKNGVSINGTLTVILADTTIYHQRRNRKTAVEMEDISINNQRVHGFMTLAYSNVGDTIHSYAMQLTDAAIYGLDGENIIAVQSSGTYVCLDGWTTPTQTDDDIWALNGNMSGTFYNNSKLRYSNSVREALLFGYGCNTQALGGAGTLTVNGRAISYRYTDPCGAPIQIETTSRE